MARRAALVLVVLCALTASVGASLFHQHDFSGRVCPICHFAPMASVQVGCVAELPPLIEQGQFILPVELLPSPEPLTSHKLPRAPPL
jgi:hypothetical protein